MKKTTTLICMVLFVATNLMAQFKTLTPKWLNPLKDTSFKLAQQYTAYTRLFLQQDKQDFIVSHNTMLGILTQQVKEEDGSTKWEFRRSYVVLPLISSTGKKTGYTASDLFFREDGNIDLLANANWLASSIYPIGYACRIVLDSKTGKELAFYNGTAEKPSALFVAHGNTSNRFLPIKGTSKDYYLQTGRTAFTQTIMATYRIDSMLMVKDTMMQAFDWKDSTNYVMANQSGLLSTGNSLCQIVAFRNPIEQVKDTLATQFVFYKYKRGALTTKSISSTFYNTWSMPVIKTVEDGFLLAGTLGATSTAANNLNPYPDNANYLSKVDTNGNIVWRTFIPENPDVPKYFRDITPLSNGKGYCLFGYTRDLSSKLVTLKLYYFDKSGKFLKEFDIDLGISSIDLNARKIWETKNGNFLCAYNFDNCNSNNATEEYCCNGIFLIKGTDIDNALSSNTLTVKSDINISPNPASEYLNIELDTEAKGVVTLYDLQGRTIKEQSYLSGEKQWQIPLSDCNNGVYIVQIQLDNGTIRSEKVVVQR